MNYYKRNNETFEPYRPTKFQWAVIVIGFISFVILLLTSCSSSPAEPIRDITDTSRPQMFSSIEDTTEQHSNPASNTPAWSPSVQGIEKLKRIFGISEHRMQFLIAMSEAFAEVESGIEPGAYNYRSGATGLHQITPIMLREYNSRSGDSLTLYDIYNPHTSSYVFCYMQLSSNPDLRTDSACRLWNPKHSRNYYECIINIFNDNLEEGAESWK